MNLESQFFFQFNQQNEQLCNLEKLIKESQDYLNSTINLLSYSPYDVTNGEQYLAIGLLNELKLLVQKPQQLNQPIKHELYKEIVIRSSSQFERLKLCDWTQWRKDQTKTQVIGFTGILGIIYICDISKYIKKSIKELSGHGGEVTDLKFNKLDPFLLASCSTDKTIRLWDCFQMQQLCVIGQTAFPTSEFSSIDWHQTSHKLVSSSFDQVIRVYDMSDLIINSLALKTSSSSGSIIDLHIEIIQPFIGDFKLQNFLLRTYQYIIKEDQNICEQVKFLNDLVILKTLNSKILILKLFETVASSKENQFLDYLLISEIDLPKTSASILDIKFDYKAIEREGSDVILAIGDADGYINIFSLTQNGLIKRQLICENKALKSVSFSQCGKYLTCSNEDRKIYFYLL
ncbi:wd domain-containing protein [Stylonychia lemnae]|uniref:Wd domain-containing protein n=1 Tax=Stylonychia lemnae TaxID=5949 RepID=A0A077ZTA1_STYLE|nr:wd domain-containing protein [Stylonychia lemnae]|eukprot:CDW71691.1 wd domain-containing protein [Stylonychia lemnae]